MHEAAQMPLVVVCDLGLEEVMPLFQRRPVPRPGVDVLAPLVGDVGPAGAGKADHRGLQVGRQRAHSVGERQPAGREL